MRIAFLEDDHEQSALIEAWLKEAGHDCQVFDKGKNLLRVLGRESFDLLILDWMLPDISGFDVLLWVRKQITDPLPVLFITAKDEEKDVVAALNAGADDYMAKPIKQGELLARINALARRFLVPAQKDGKVVFGEYTLYPALKLVEFQDEKLELTAKEFDLVYFLFRHEGRIISRGHILESVWGATSELNTRTVDTHISRIRTKLMLKGKHGWLLHSVYQHGYRLEKTPEDEVL